MFEAVQFIEVTGEPEPRETLIGQFPEEQSAVDAARAAKATFMANRSRDYAWWIVRQSGARLAEFISDSKSNKEFVLDLDSGQLVEVV